MTLSRTAVLLAGALLATPPAAASLRGKVLLDGRPLAGATVAAIPQEESLEVARREARGEPEPAALATVATLATGEFDLRVAAPEGRDVFFRVRVSATGAVPVELPETRDATEEEDLGDLALRRAEPLAGRVRGPDGAPVAGALVRLVARGRADGPVTGTAQPQEATTGADGQFRFATAAAERNELRVRAAGFAPARVRNAKPGALPREISLEPGHSLSGIVRKKDGRPAAKALVRWEGNDAESRWVETGEDGSFRLADLPKRRGTVVADGGEHGFAEAGGATPGSAEPLVLSLAPPAILEGRTLDASTLKPVPRVRLEVATDSGRFTARTGHDGRYRVRGLRPGSATVRAEEPRHVPWTRHSVPIEKGASRTLDVLLTRGATLSGRVVDEDGRPVAGAGVSLLSSSESSLDAAVRLRGEASRLRTRPDGSFTATRLPPGENQRLSVQHPEFERGTVGGISLVAGGTRSGVVVTIRRGVVLTGRVSDPDGNPIAGAEVSAGRSFSVRSSSGGSLTRVRVEMMEAPRTARSGGDGAFELRGLAPGGVSVTVKAPGRATETVDPVLLERGARPDPVEIVLEPGATISGRIVRRTGEGASGYFVLAQNPRKPSGGRGSTSATPEADGTFRIEGLRAGETYDLQLFGTSAGFGPGPRKAGILAPADGVEWVVEGTGRIEGSAVDAKTGQPLGAFEVSYQSDRQGTGRVIRVARGGGRFAGGAGEAQLVESPDGRFALEEVPSGKWQVVVTAKGYQVGRAAGVVVEDATTTDGVEVRVAPGSVLRGIVKDARSRRGVPDARVRVRGETGDGGSSQGPGGLFTDVEGRFEAEGLAPGKVTVTAEHADYTARTESAVLAEGGSSVEIALSRGSGLGGVVLSETRQPVAGASVSLEGGAARGGGFGGGDETTTDGAGRFRFDHLSPARYTLRASVPGQSSEPAEAVVVEGEAVPDVTLVLSGGATLRGSVSGLPETLRGAVNVSANGPRDYWATVRTGPDGRFELSGVPAGQVSVRASAGDLASGTMRSANASVSIAEGQTEAEVEIVFEGDGALSGRVTRGGKPVADARIVAGAARTGRSASARTDETGAYRIEGITPGEYEVWVQADAYGRAGNVSRTVSIDGEARLDVELPVASLFGIVVDASTKQPLAEVRVAASLEGGAEGRPGAATSDSNGRFFVEELEEASYTLSLRRSGYQDAKSSARASEGGGDAGTIEMTRGDGLEVRVRDGIYGIPLRSALVRVKDGRGDVGASTWLTLDGDGKGEIAFLRPGTYTIVVAGSHYAPRTFENVGVPGPALQVTLTPGGMLELKYGPVAIAKGFATVLDALGRPYAFRAYGPEGRITLTAAGYATIEGLAPGSYTLSVEGMEPKAFSVVEGGKALVELP
ncbi:MAG TPA: carboxypeptidase-like regulatory domain-containing protein [Thermoanaerobaculia bacterium]|nr:carboxypeptidase-like regulatory domain-containing protein [Thermoanaerobaculia bacterium]HQP85028.1 carboxypeptidase-like regulatory domain-containing protein [Thermoanaerobaculia bacterium]